MNHLFDNLAGPFARIGLVALTFGSMIGTVGAYEPRLRRQFEKLDPQTRLEEVCDTEVLLRINKENPSLKVDKVVAYTFRQPVEKNDRVSADGAAFRSHGKWFRLQFRCQTGPRHLDVKELSYQLGSEIEKELWRRLFLYD